MPLQRKSRHIEGLTKPIHESIDSFSSQRRPLKKKRTEESAPIYEGINKEYVPNAPLALPAPKTCKFCRSLKFAYEFPTFCFYNGEVNLVPLDICPQILDLFTRTDEVGYHFKTCSRAYNYFFAFSCIGADGVIDAIMWKGYVSFLL